MENCDVLYMKSFIRKRGKEEETVGRFNFFFFVNNFLIIIIIS